MEIKLNSKSYTISINSSLANLIDLLNINPHSIITEVNLEIIKKEKREDTILKNGDSVEIITFMGGG